MDSIQEAAQRLAETFGWTYVELTDGTIVFEPPDNT